jgi:hybrid polyketide synthase/nonribosomal peptide synthetase ACE1
MFTPFVFSGPSERALAATLQNYLTHIQENKHCIFLQDLAWTLQYKRSQFHHRYALAASSIDDLEAGLLRALSSSDRKQEFGPIMHAKLQSRSNLRIMGIYTGQGAQWATMGKELIERSPYVRRIVERLDEALASLPATDRPDWKLREELLLGGEKSRISEAMLAQPLTTAIQILMVDLVAVAGLKFHTIVGHSSGEIAAAYATGLLNANDAIRIAYYRDLHFHEAKSKSGEPGAMFAAALSADRAQEFCCLLRYKGYLTVAAFNGPNLVTISGDRTHVARAIAELEEDGTFVRQLQVDMAYHSKHMSPCAAPYLRSLKRLQMPSLELNEHCPSWYSSVFPGKRVESADQLGPAYWIQNLLAPVQFASAVQTAVTQKGVPDVVLEIGPHLTLEKAVRQVLGDSGTTTLVYTGLLKRGVSAVESYATALGHIWTRHGRGAVDFANVEAVLSSRAALPKQLKDLPAYAWLHDAEYWWENRFLQKR